MAKVKLLHLIHGLGSGGAEAMLFKLLENTSPKFQPQRIVSMSDLGSFGKKILALGFEVDCLRLNTPTGAIKGLSRLVQILKREKPDALLTWSYQAAVLGSLIPLGSVGSGATQRFWNIRCSDAELRRGFSRTTFIVRLLAKLSKQPAAILVNSEAGKKFHEGMGFSPKRWIHIPNGFDTQRFRPNAEARLRIRSEWGISVEATLIGIVGRFDPLKDHRNFILAALQFQKMHKKAHFLLVGAGLSSNNRLLQDLIKISPYPESFHLVGEQEKVADFLASLDLFSLSSLTEGFPNALGEAMACAVPCVSTNTGDVALILNNAERVVPIHNAEALCNAWEMFFSLSKEQRNAEGLRNRIQIEKHYAISEIVKRYQETFFS